MPEVFARVRRRLQILSTHDADPLGYIFDEPAGPVFPCPCDLERRQR
jgi:hypothetical protein